MGNEASLEGGEGGLAGLPEGIVSDGKGGFIQIPAGTEADLSKLSEEERKQIAAVMSKAQTKPPGNAKDAPTQRTSEVDAIHQPRQPGKPPTQGPSGLSKSRTVDAFRTGPAARQAPPGRSPSSLSLLESLSRQEAREETRSSMFSSNFLSGANPLSAVSSAVNKFSLFGDEEPEEEKKQKAAAQQAGPAKQGQGPPQQRGSQGPQQQTAPKGGPQPQGPTKPGPQQQQGPTKPGPQQQGPAKPGPQQQGPSKPGPQGPSKPGPQGPSKPGPQGPSKPGPQQQQGPGKPGLCQQGPPSTGAQSAGPAKTGAPPSGPGVAGPKQSEGPSPGKSTCPLCKTTELTLHTKEQPNYNTCTQCKTVVCSLCGFSPPDSEGKEWLCLNCQMQRALGGMDAPAPPKMKPQPQPSKQPSAPSSPQKKQATPDTQGHKPEAAKPAEAKKPSPLKKQPTLSDTGKPGTPPSTPPSARKGPAQAPEKGTGPQEAHKPSGTQKPQDQPGPTGTKQDMTGPQSASPAPLTQAAQKPAQQPSIKPAQQQEQQPPDQKPSGGAVKTDPKAGPLTQEPHKSPQQMPKGGAGPSPAKPGAPPQAQPPPQPPKQESSFFGLSFGGFSEPPKPQPGKPPPTTPQAPESVSGKLFGFGGFSEAPKQPAAAPPAESVSGKMFGFGSSIFSSASSLITTTAQDQPPAQPPATSKEPTPAQPSPKKPPAAEGKPSAGQKPETSQQAKPTPPTPEKKTIPTKADKPPTEPPKVMEPPQPAPKEASSNCPLCKVELNVGSKDTPSYNTCTECRKTVCNLCGFNPMPHLNEKEWLCLNCQTQRALAGQLGDMPPPMPAPTKPENQQPAPTKLQTSPAKQSAPQMAEPVTTEPSPPKPAPVEQNAVNTESAAPASPAIAPKPATSSPAKEPTRLATNDHTPPQKPADMARTAEITEGAKKAEAVTRETIKEPTGETEEKADNKSEISVSSEVITDSLGETPSIIPSEKNELLKEPVKKDGDAPETSPTSPSDLAKLESTVLSILEAQKSTDKNENASNVHDQKQEQHRPKTLPISAESFSSEEGELEDAREVGKSAVKDAPIVTAQKKERKKLHVLPEGRQRYDSVEDSSESEPSPLQQRRRKISAASTSSEEYKLDSPGSGDDEDFIRKQIMEMSADEDASEDEDNYIRKQIKEEEEKREQDDKKVKCKSTSGKSKRLLKKSSVSHELEPERRHSWQESEEQECEESSDSKNRETKSQEGEAPSIDSGGGLRRFKTIELNNTTASPYNAGATVRQGTEEGELEMESLTDSPEDRSRGESSSLHASSFTPGTSPTSVSSFDEDSDSSPSHKRTSGEGKQHRKARHRQHGQVLPTIEDSSEEEEMREEEELLREQEKQREVDQQQVKKSSSKKSKKDKEELRAQRRREHPKTPPSNLSPIEDASPTEELRQAAEMEELHKSSCSEYSPSIESEPEGFEIHPDKIIAVQKVYKLPTSVSLYSPTEEQNTEMTNDMDKSLKSADEAYEEMMQNVKTLQGKKETEEQLEKEPLYGGMLIEDYIYESLVENKVTGNYVAQKKESSKISVQEPVKKLKSPDEAYEDMQRRKEIILKEQGLQQTQPVKTPSQPQQDMDLPAITCKPTYVNISTSNTAPPTKDGKPLLDAEAAYEELMKRQRVILTPGTSPTQPVPELNDMVLTPPKSGAEDNQEGGVIAEALVRNNTHDMPVSSDTSSNRALYPIPDLKITQCSSGEEDVEEEESIAQKQEKVKPTEASQAGETVMKVEQTSVASSPAPVSPSAPSPVQVTAPAVAPAPAQAAVAASTPVPVQVSAPEAAPVPISVPTEIAPPPPPPPPPLPSSVTTSPAITETPRVSAACVSSSVSTPLDLTSSPSETAQPAVLGIESMVEDLSKPRSSIHENVVSGHISNMPATVTPPLLPLVMQSAQEPVVASDISVTNICPVTGVISLKTSIASVSAIPTVPHYAPAVSSIVSTAVSATFSTTHTHTSAPPIPPKPAVLLRGSSQEKADIDNAVPPPPPPPPPPLPPPTLPKPAVYPKKPSISTPPIMPAVASVSASTAVTVIQATITTPDSTLRNAAAPTYRPHVPPPIPPKPASIPVGLTFSHKPGESVKPPVAPKPAVVQPASQAIAMIQARPAPPPSTTAMALNLSTPVEYKPSATSPRSPLSPRYGNSLHETYVVITLPSEPGTPVEGIITQAPISPALVSPMQHIAQAAVPLAYTHYTNSVEIQGTDKVVSSMSQIYSSMSTSTQPVVPLPNLVAQVVTTEVQRTTVSVVREKIPVTPLVPATRTATEVVTVAQGTPKAQPIPKENGKIYYSGDVVDLRTLKQDAEMTDKGLDLSATDSRGHSISADASGHQTSAVQSVVVNLSTEATPLSSLSIGTDNITIVTCTATISCAGNRPLNLGHTTSMPLQLTTSRSFEPVAQIVYRPIDSQPTTNFNTEAPINLSFGAITSADTSRSPLTPASLSDHISGHLAHNEAGLASAVDLTTTKPIQTMVAVNGSNSAVVTTVVEDDGKPVDLTAGKRVVCCDVVYKLPFAGSCTTQQPTTALPEDRFGYRDDHYQYNRSGPYSMKGFGGMKSSMSDTNLAEAGLFFYKSKNSYDYQNGATEGAVDLTSGKLSTGEIMDYSSKGTGAYPSMTVPQYSQARITPVVGTHFGTNSMLRSSNGVVYSSVAAPVPSTYAITTQPGSIFSTTYNSLSGMHTSDTMPSLSSLQDHPLPRSYSFFTTTAAEQQAAVSQEIGLSKEGLSPAFTEAVPTATTMPGSYTDASLEAIAASLEALASPMVPGTDESTQQYQMEREFLELEKMKQLRLAEELEWERQEIQRFREQEQLIVQKELEELQTMKQQLLFQQEEERQAHLMMQQETYAQQQLQLEQIQQLQQQLQQQLEEQKMRQMFPYDPPTTSEQALLDAHYAGGEGSQYWPEQDQTGVPSNVAGLELQQNATWYTVPTEGVAQYISNLPESEIPLKESEGQELAIHTDRTPGQYDEHGTDALTRKIVESGVQTDEEEGADKACIGRRKRNKRSVDSSVQTDDEDQDEWDIPARSRRRSRSSKQGSKVSSIAIQTVAEISVQTDHSGTIKRPSVRAQVDTKLEIKQISAPEKTYRGGSTSCQTEVGSGKTSPQKDKRRPTPLEIGHSTHLKADSTLQVAPSPPKSPKVLYSPISPLSPSKSLEFAQYEKSVGDTIPQKMLTAESSKPPTSPRTLKAMQRSLSDPKPQSPTSEERTGSNFQYSDGYSGKGSQSSTPSGTQKKVKRTLPNPPPEEESAASQTGYSTGSARRRLCRNTTMARAKILQDIDRELDLVERESSKLRKKQAELDEEEKEIDAKLRYLEMGINRRKDALLKEREKRERAYLQGVAEERDYMSDSEVSNIRETRGNGHGLERPRTAPQSEFNQFIPPQTQPEAQYAQSGGSYTQYPYAPQTQATTQYPQQTLYQQPSLYHQQVSPYQSQSIYSSVPSLSYPQSSHQQSQQQSYQHTSQMLLMQQKARQTTLSDLEPKITTNYEVIRSQPLMMGSSSTDTSYAVPHLAGKYSSLDLRLGLEERGSMASSPMSSISADSFYADIDHHTPRNYVLIDDIGELTKSSAGLSSSFTIPDKDLAKADRLLRAAEARRSAEVTDYLGPLQASSRLHSYNKPEEDAMEEPYELKLLKQQIKQEFRRGTDSLDPLTGLPHYYPGESSYRHFPKTEKYSISRLTLEKQAAKQLPASVLYQKQAKHKKALMDPKITKFSPIQESKDLEPDYSSYLGSSVSSVSSLSSRARLLQDELTFGLRKNITEQQKYLGSTLGANLAQSLNLGQSLNLSPTLRSSLQDDTAYPSGSRSRPSSRPSSVYGLDLSLKRDLSSSSLRLKTEGDALDPSFTTPSVRTKPTSLPISQSRGRIPIVAQNSEEESPLSPVGQPMGMARASAGPLPPISADSRDQFGSSHSLPEVQQHMREESRTRGYDRDIAFMMDDLQGAMSDSEALSDSLVTLSRDDPRYTHEHMKDAGGSSWDTEAYHLRREETDWFDKPREARLENGHGVDRRQIKSIHYPFPHTRIKLLRDPKDHSVSGNGLGIRVVGGKDIPGNNGDIGAYIAKVLPGGAAELTGKIVEGMQVLEWNGIPLTGKTYEEVQSLVGQQCGEAELCVRLDLNMLSDSEHPQHLELHDQTKTGDKQRSPGVDPKQLAAELQKVSQQQTPSTVLSASEKGPHIHSGTASAGSSAVPSPGQPASPSVSKKRHGSKSAEAVKTQSHPVSGEIQLQINYDKNLGNLIVHVLQARNLPPRDNNGYSDPFVKVYLLPGRGAENKRRTKHAQKSLNPEWNQTVIYKNIHLEQIKKKTLEVTVWDYDRFSSNDFLGEVLIDLSNTVQLDNVPRWFPLKEQSESQERSHSSQGSQQSPKPSVIKSRSHGVFPDPSKDMQVPTIEKSHSSPGSSKSSSEGHARSHGPSRSQSKSSVTQAHLEDAGVAIAAAEAAVQQLRLQPIHKSSRTKKHHRHSIAGVLTIHRTQSDYLPAPANEMKDTSQLTIRKMMSEGTPKKDGARSGHRATDATATTTSSTSSLGSSGLTLDEEGGTNAVDSAIFQVPRIGKTIPNGTDKTRGSDPLKPSLGLGDTEAGKTQMMGEIKIALKKEMKTEGEQLIVEILQCRNITYKFKTPDHLPDLYVKLYVVNVATQKRIIKKKTRVCRHDREPSFNETFRFSMNPAGHSIQLFLVSNGGKFVKKTLIGEAYIWLDKVDLRKRSVSWHKLLASSTQANS